MAKKCKRCVELEAECDDLTEKLDEMRDERDSALSDVESLREQPYLRIVK